MALNEVSWYLDATRILRLMMMTGSSYALGGHARDCEFASFAARTSFPNVKGAIKHTHKHTHKTCFKKISVTGQIFYIIRNHFYSVSFQNCGDVPGSTHDLFSVVVHSIAENRLKCSTKSSVFTVAVSKCEKNERLWPLNCTPGVSYNFREEKRHMWRTYLHI